MERLWKFDYIKVLCIWSVIIIHSTDVENMGYNLFFPYYILMAVPLFMIISGYVNAKSCKAHSIVTLEQYYEIPNLWKKFTQIIIPYVIVYLCEWAIETMVLNRSIDLKQIIYTFISGGWGPGGYYVIMLVQFILCFPFIYILIQKKPLFGSIAIILLQLMMEIAIQYWNVPVSVYRLTFIRYIVFIMCGILIYKYSDKITNSIILVLGIVGFAIIWLITYTGYEERIFRYWTSTSMPTALWAVFLILCWMKWDKPFSGLLHKIVLEIGSSTYFIFLTQMLYFIIGFDQRISGTIGKSIVAIAVCSISGCIFRHIYEKMLQLLKIR